MMKISPFFFFLFFFSFTLSFPSSFFWELFGVLGVPLLLLDSLALPLEKQRWKLPIKILYKTLRYSGWNLLCLPLFLLFVLFGSARSLLLAFHQPQESQEQENLGDMCKDLSFLLENLKRRRKTKFWSFHIEKQYRTCEATADKEGILFEVIHTKLDEIVAGRNEESFSMKQEVHCRKLLFRYFTCSVKCHYSQWRFRGRDVLCGKVFVESLHKVGHGFRVKLLESVAVHFSQAEAGWSDKDNVE